MITSFFVKVFVVLSFSTAILALSEGEHCQTPKNGVCQQIKDCASLKNSKVTKSFLKKYHCGFFEGGSTPLICCPDEEQEEEDEYKDMEPLIDAPVSMAVRVSADECETPQGFPGTVELLKQCEPLNEIFQNKPLSEENKELLRRSKVRMEGKKFFVCCPLPPTTTPSPVYQPCKDANKNDGTCVKVKECPAILSIVSKKPLIQKDLKFVRGSQCGFVDRTPYVCCANEPEESEEETNEAPKVEETTEVVAKTTTEIDEPKPEWLQKLHELLPKAPKCGRVHSENIFGGEVAGLYDHPWAVLVEYKKPDGSFGFHCGGSLINKRYVLTAAHCIKKVGFWKVSRVRLGEWDLNSVIDCVFDEAENKECSQRPPVDVNVTEITVYKDYRAQSKSQHFDIALLRLAQPVTFSEYVKPICLPLDPALWNKNYTGHSFGVAGWGSTENKTQSNVKLQLDIKYVSFDQCRRRYRSSGAEIQETQICVGGEAGKDTCKGDSGGPLIGDTLDAERKPYSYLAGIVSFGPSECGTIGIPGVYTKVSSFLEWISENIRK